MHSVRIPIVPLVLCILLPAPSVQAAAAGDDILEEIVVTGTLRAQKLGDAPVSVTVLGAGTLQDAGQQHFQDVLGLVPNLNWAGGTSRPRYFQIRGIGEREQYEGAPNPSVGFLIDEIDFSGLGMPATLFDIKQVEVLRGPQGTRYGANALAGLIVVRGNEPDRDAGYSLEASGGDYGTGSLGFTATGPMAVLDSAWRLSVQKYESDGFMRNAFLGRDDTNGRDELTARLKWHGELGPGSALDFTFLHADLDNGYDAWTLDNSRTSLSDKPGQDSQLANGAALKFTTGVGGDSLTVIAGHADSKSVNSYDSDWGNDASWAPYVYDYTFRSDRHRRTGSLELRLASPAGDTQWLVGAYALRLNESGRDVGDGRYADPGDPEYISHDELGLAYHATNLALFGQLDGLLAPGWHWSAGGRLEQRRAHYRDDGTVTRLDAHDRMVGGQFTVSRDLHGDASAYASLSRGYKAGGFNLGEVSDARRRFDPEFLWNLEAGIRGRFAAGRGQADVSLFHQRRQDQQVRTGVQLTPGDPNTYQFITVNLPKGYGTGLEGSVQYAVMRGLQLGASLGLLHTRSGAFMMQDADGNAVLVPSRANAHAPGWNAAVNATWRSRGGFMARVDLTAMDEFYFDVPTDHDMKSRRYALANLKIGYERERWGVYGWVRNVFNKDYAVRGFFFANEPPDWNDKLYVQQGDPRQLGLTVNFWF